MAAHERKLTPAEEYELRGLILAEYRRSERRKASCDGKQGFETPEDARNVRVRRKTHTLQMVYRCEFCGLWHVGSHLGTKASERRPRADERLAA